MELSVAATLSSTFTNQAENLSAKKFDRNIKRATKALLTGVKKKKDKQPKKPGGQAKQMVTGAIN